MKCMQLLKNGEEVFCEFFMLVTSVFTTNTEKALDFPCVFLIVYDREKSAIVHEYFDLHVSWRFVLSSI